MCPDRQILSAYLDGEIAPPWERAVADHLAGCDSCRAAWEAMALTRRVLQEAARGDLSQPMERVRRAVLAGRFALPPRQGPWRRRLSVPLPLAAAAAAAILFLAVGFAVALARSGMGYIRVTAGPSGGTEYQVAVPYDKVEALLKSVGGAAANSEDVIALPKDMKLVPVGRPLMVREDELPRAARKAP